MWHTTVCSYWTAQLLDNGECGCSCILLHGCTVCAAYKIATLMLKKVSSSSK